MVIGIVRSPDYDWIGLYKDGKLIEEGHSIQEEDVVKLLLGVTVTEYRHKVATEQELDEWGYRCPQTFPDE